MNYDTIKSTTNGFINLYNLQINAFKKKLYNCNNKDLRHEVLNEENNKLIY